jgi:hypothetical protein
MERLPIMRREKTIRLKNLLYVSWSGRRWIGWVVLLLIATNPGTLHSQIPPEDVIKNVLQSSESNHRRLFVLPLNASGMTESAARVFSHMIAGNLKNTNRFEIIYFDVVEEEVQRQMPSLLPCYEIGCGIQIGKLLGLNWVVSGQISLTESGLFSLNVKLVNIFDNSLAFEDTIRFSDENMDRRFYELSNRIANNAPLNGRVLSANNKTAVIDLGEQNGITVGDRLILYRYKTIGDTEDVRKVILRRHNIGILTITRVGKNVSEGVYFQTIETPESGHHVSSYLDKRKQIKLVEEIRKELDTQERTIYEIKKSVVLSPVQLEDIARKKWANQVRSVETERDFWQLMLLGSGIAATYFLSQFQPGDDIKLMVSIGALAYSTYEYFTARGQLRDLQDEGRYKGYLELKIRPGFSGIGVGVHYRF